MERIGALAAILLVLVVAPVPDASSRILMADGRGGGKIDSEKVSPSPTPNPSPETSVSGSSQKPQEKSHVSPSRATNSSTGDPDGSEDLTKSGSPTDRSQVDSCHASSKKCQKGELIACLQYSENDSKKLLLLVQNTGENNMTVKIKASPIKINDGEKQIANGSTTKIPINAAKGLEMTIVLYVGNESCTLQTKASFDWNPFQLLPAYAAHLTPIYGAYFLFVTMVISGGAWACCKFRRGRRADRIPYQQLEMGTQAQSTSAVVDSDTVDGWDEGWDEDWDEDEAAPQPSEKHTTGSVSANGLTSRSPRKDGWDVDWDV